MAIHQLGLDGIKEKKSELLHHNGKYKQCWNIVFFYGGKKYNCLFFLSWAVISFRENNIYS